jgi:hypothetical protein
MASRAMSSAVGRDEAIVVAKASSMRSRGRSIPVLIAGAATACLVAACTAGVWSAGAPLRAGATTGQGMPRLYLPCLWTAFAAYLVSLALIRRRHPDLWAIVTVAIAIQLLPLSAPLLGSTDAWSYWDYASIAATHGANPYAVKPSVYPRDAAYGHMGAAWHTTTSVYGPAFTLASEPVALAANGSATAAAWTFKTLAAAGVLLAAALAGLLARRTAFAVAFVGWNPLLAVDFAGGGHNDVLMVVLVLTALALAAMGRRGMSSTAWAASIYVKWVSALLLPLHLLAERAAGRRMAWRSLVTALAAGALIATAAFGLHWPGAAMPLAHTAAHGSRFAIPHRLESAGLPRWAALTVVASAFTVAYALLLRSAARGRARLGLASGLLLLAAPYLVSWYTVWAVPFAAAEEDAAAQLVSLGLCAYLLRQGIHS